MGYLGSKAASGAYQAIIASMPVHDTYIETHLGSGAVMVRKPVAARSIGIDIDEQTLEQFAAVPGVELHCGDAVAFLRSFDYQSAGRVLVYADPPYLLETRTSRHRYRYEYTTQDHYALLSVLVELASLGVSVMVSGYPSVLYDQMLPMWRTREFQVMTRGGVRTEKLWLSFPASSVHWATFAGSTFTERQRIKRKAQRWAENYRALAPAERIAVLAAMLECEQPGSIAASGYAGQHSYS
jgi:DNA adenine methylase